jgi:septum formation protein
LARAVAKLQKNRLPKASKGNMYNTLYLASKSPSRRYLLTEAQIPFTMLAQSAQEEECGLGLPLERLVRTIALYKMKHVVLPQGQPGEVRFVLTADTLTQSRNGTIHGKPVDRQDAIAKIRALRDGSTTCTAFCLDKKVFTNDTTWHTEHRITQAVAADCVFYVPDAWIDVYLTRQPLALQAAGALAIEGFGISFLKHVQGSYSTIIGLPLFEVRQALESLGFFNTSFFNLAR